MKTKFATRLKGTKISQNLDCEHLMFRIAFVFLCISGLINDFLDSPFYIALKIMSK